MDPLVLLVAVVTCLGELAVIIALGVAYDRLQAARDAESGYLQ